MKVVALLLAAVALAGAQQRIGTFDRKPVIVAFYRSGLWAGALRAKAAEHSAAVAAGDRARIAELERWGREQQTLAHRQLSGKAALDNILADMRPDLDRIARECQVEEIRETAPAGATSLDVTDRIMEVLKRK